MGIFVGGGVLQEGRGQGRGGGSYPPMVPLFPGYMLFYLALFILASILTLPVLLLVGKGEDIDDLREGR